jgi:acyl dehydratase
VETVELESPPSLSRLYAKAVVAPLLPGGGEELPDREFVLRGAELEPQHVAAYSRVCAFSLRDEVPGTFPHVLAFPLQLQLMTDRSFPFPLAGMVHIANRIDVLAPLRFGSEIDIHVRAADPRPHRRGRQFDLLSEARRKGETVWKGRSTYLRREKNAQDSNGSGDDTASRESPQSRLESTAVWRLPGDIGRRYAGVSGDRNPIHLHPLTARALGFPSAIAHGMWTKARCLASFEGRLPAAYAIEIEFKAPLRIPGTARFLSAGADGSWSFAVESVDGEHEHASGSISPG